MELEAHQVTLQQIPRGDQGIRITVSKIAELIRQGSIDPYVRAQRDLLDSSVAKERIYFPWSLSSNYIDQVFKFARTYPFKKDSEQVADDFPELDDPERTEYLRSARFIIENRSTGLDCDDYSILIGSLMLAARIPVRLVVIAANPNKPKKFSHVYPEVNVRGKWIAMDALFSEPGQYHTPWFRRMFIKV